MSRPKSGRAAELLVGLEVRRTEDRGPGGAGEGRGLFVIENVAPGRRILRFGGDLLDRTAMSALIDREHYLQVGPNRFLGPSGDLDDYANHSCAPSAKVEIDARASTAWLTALRALDPGDEVTFDYSTVQLNDPGYRIDDCRCGSASCRRVVEDFSLMPTVEQERLVRSGLCAWYLVDAFERSLGQAE